MKRIIAILMVGLMLVALCACGDSSNTDQNNSSNTDQNNSSNEKSAIENIEGTWTLELPFKQGGKGTPAYQMVLHKGGTGEGYEKKDDEIVRDSFYPLKWEIKDDVLVISYEADPISWSFEISEDGSAITEVTSGNVFTKE